MIVTIPSFSSCSLFLCICSSVSMWFSVTGPSPFSTNDALLEEEVVLNGPTASRKPVGEDLYIPQWRENGPPETLCLARVANLRRLSRPTRVSLGLQRHPLVGKTPSSQGEVGPTMSRWFTKMLRRD